MSYVLVFNSEVEAEFKEAYQWYDTQKKGLGERFEIEVERKLLSILTNPNAYHFSKGKYREAALTKFPYSIVFKVDTRKHIVYVSAIHHSSRNPKNKYRG